MNQPIGGKGVYFSSVRPFWPDSPTAICRQIQLNIDTALGITINFLKIRKLRMICPDICSLLRMSVSSPFYGRGFAIGVCVAWGIGGGWPLTGLLAGAFGKWGSFGKRGVGKIEKMWYNKFTPGDSMPSKG